MFIKWFESMCPQCRLEDKDELMLLNDRDWWECPVCHLQISTISYLHAIVINACRGNGDLRPDSADVRKIPNPTGRALCEVGRDETGHPIFFNQPGDWLDEEEKLRSYISTIEVSPERKRT